MIRRKLSRPRLSSPQIPKTTQSRQKQKEPKWADWTDPERPKKRTRELVWYAKGIINYQQRVERSEYREHNGHRTVAIVHAVHGNCDSCNQVHNTVCVSKWYVQIRGKCKWRTGCISLWSGIIRMYVCRDHYINIRSQCRWASQCIIPTSQRHWNNALLCHRHWYHTKS